jgi:hypothetical protein
VGEVLVDEVTDIQGAQNIVMNHMPNGTGKRATLRTIPDELRSVLQGREKLPEFKNLENQSLPNCHKTSQYACEHPFNAARLTACLLSSFRDTIWATEN